MKGDYKPFYEHRTRVCYLSANGLESGDLIPCSAVMFGWGPEALSLNDSHSAWILSVWAL